VNVNHVYENRRSAGRELAAHLAKYRDRSDAIILALPRGGVPVAYEVARALELPLDVFIVRKLGVPGHEELAMGAIASGGVRVFKRDVLALLDDRDEIVERVSRSELIELERREHRYRGQAKPLELEGKTVILIDDGLATGATMRAAVAALRKLKAARIVVGVPVGAPETCAELSSVAEEVICVTAPSGFRAVGEFYHDFSQTTDEEVAELIEASRAHRNT
jgi:putative phosphoribosyl transferase